MSSLFKTPKMPNIPPPPVAPVIEDDDSRIRQAEIMEKKRLRKRHGVSSNMLTGGLGVSGPVNLYKPKLLGT